MAIIFDLFENSVKDGIVASKLHVKRWGDYPLKSGSDTRKMYRSPGGCIAGAGTILPIPKAKQEIEKIKKASTKQLPPKELREIELN